MAPADEEKAFLRSAVAAIPRIAEIICGLPPDDRAGALETAERHFMEAALEFGCTEIAARSRVSAVMARLRGRMEEQRISEKKLQALLHRLTESD
jgi:DNA-directed RNA polymerase specialized sigma24 family protein